jgi:nicotinamidase-related amidase
MTEWHDDLSKAALLVWDMQYGIAMKAFNLGEIVPKIKSLIDAMHSLGLPIIYTQTTGLPYEYQSAYSIYRQRRRGIDPKKNPQNLEGSHDWQLIDEMKPEKSDLVLKKYSPSLFVGTIAEQFLRNLDIDSLILTGVSTEFGVETTARHAACLGFVPIIAEDAVGSGDRQAHSASLEAMQRMFEVKSTEGIIRVLKANSAR